MLIPLKRKRLVAVIAIVLFMIITFAQGHKDDHPNDSQVEGEFELEGDEGEGRHGRVAPLQHFGTVKIGGENGH